jgi:hypothetical protein
MTALSFDDDVETEGSSRVAFGFGNLSAVSGMGMGPTPGAILGNIYFSVSDTSVIGDVQPIWLAEMRDKIQELSTLGRGWDGYGAVPLDRIPLRAAWEFVRSFSPFLRVPPALVPTSAGGVVLEWHRAGTDLEIEFTLKGEADVSFDDESGGDFEGPLEHWLPRVASIIVTLE